MTPLSLSPKTRIWIIAAVLLIGFALLIAQLVRWQVVDRSRLLPDASAQAPAGGIARGPERGAILDTSGEPLAFDTFRWEIWLEPWLVDQERAVELTNQLVEALGGELTMTPDALYQLLVSNEQTPITLTKRAPQFIGEAINAWDNKKGLGLMPHPVRLYPQHSLAAHVLGFVNSEPRAYYGVEQYYDDYLWRIDTPFFHSDATYSRLPAGWQTYLPSAAGQDLVLTIDRRVQYIVERVLAEAIGRYQAESGTIIVMEPHTGRILAMASLPAFDPNRYGLTNDTVLSNPATSKQYEPGSIFKIVTIASAIDAGLITPDSVLTDTVELEVGGRTIQNSDRKSHGEVTVRETLVHSLNIPTAKVALMMEESLFYQYVRRFGFGQLTEVDLANETPGTVKTPGNPLWSRSDLATNAFGQGLAVTPLQMTLATAVIANGGLLVRPHVVDSMVLRGQVIRPGKAPVRRVIQRETAATMTDLMISVVEDGATKAGVYGYTVAGKTGTAQVAIEGGYHPTQTIQSFVGFAPANDPLFVALVKLDKPKTSPWAVHTAAPTFAELSRQLLYFMHAPPDSALPQASARVEDGK